MTTHRGPINPFAAAREELSGRFLVWEPVRRGAHAAVFAAHEVRTGRKVTLCLVLRSALARAMITDDFRQALAQAAALDHPGIVRILSSGTTTSFDWYATEQLEPETQLTNIIRTDGALPGHQIVRIAEQMDEALAYAHKRGLAHGHLTPSTIHVDHQGVVRASEFATRNILGLLAQHPGRPVPAAAKERSGESILAMQRRDRYQLALILQECIAGYEIATSDPIQKEEIPLSIIATDNYRELESRIEQRGPAPKPIKDRIDRAIGGEGRDPAVLPTVAEIASELGPTPRRAYDEELPQVVAPAEEERAIVLMDEPSFVFSPQPEERKRWPLLASVAMVTVVTWLALEQFPIGSRESSPDTVILTRSAVTLNEPALSPERPPMPARDTEPEKVPDRAAVSTPSRESVAAPRRDSDRKASTSLATNTDPATSSAALAPDRSGGRSSERTGAARDPDRTGGTKSTPVKEIAQINNASAAEPPPATGRLSISTRPWGYLFVNGAAQGNTPASNISLPAGTHSVRVVREGFQAFERQITVAPGGVVRLIDLVLTRQGSR